LFWIKDAPQNEKDSNEKGVAFGDKFIICCKRNSSSKMENLVNLQMHRHAKTRKRSGNNIHRFKILLPPVPRTMILKPLEESYLDEECKLITDNSEKK